jgi:hypothetical protein
MQPIVQACVLLTTSVMVQADDGSWYDENVPSSEGVRPRGKDDIVEGRISIEVQHRSTC